MQNKINIQRAPLRTILFLAFVLMLVTRPSYAQQTECYDCHEEIQDAVDNGYYVHEPVREGKCDVCHAADSMQLPVGNKKPQQQKYVLQYQQNDAEEQAEPIKWLAENFTPQTQQFALIAEKRLKDKIILDLWYPGAGKQQQALSTPELTALIAQRPQHKMLSIDNLYLTGYDTRLLSRATLNWQTNEPSRCIANYGNDNLDNLFEEDDLYLRDHHLELRNFSKAGYVVEIQCRDPFKRKKTTDHFNINQLPIKEELVSQNSGDQQTDVNFYKIKNKLWISVATASPASLSVGTQQADKNEILDEETLPTIPNRLPGQYNPAPEEEHIVLNSRHYTNTEVCHTCHSGLEEGTSHPVNVQPPPNMIIPPEYPRLRDGRISCMSCHTVHAGNEEYRLLKKSKKKLCTGCHTNY